VFLTDKKPIPSGELASTMGELVKIIEKMAKNVNRIRNKWLLGTINKISMVVLQNLAQK